jgi:hypothetical protein
MLRPEASAIADATMCQSELSVTIATWTTEPRNRPFHVTNSARAAESYPVIFRQSIRRATVHPRSMSAVTGSSARASESSVRWPVSVSTSTR